MTRFSLARNYRGDAPPNAAVVGRRRCDRCVELQSSFSRAELEGLQVGQRVRVHRYGRRVAGEVVSVGPVPPLRDGRRVVRDVHNQTTPDVGARKVVVRLQLVGRTRDVEVRALELIPEARA
jgi:hypothetical protein